MRRLFGLYLILSLCCASAQTENFKAGFAKVDITPPLELKTSLGGYGERMSQPATGVHDRLFAKAVVFVQGDRKFALVTADALGFPPAFRPAVLERLSDSGWTADQVMLLPSHSHTAFDMSEINPKNQIGIPQLGIFRPDLYEILLERFAAVIEEAEESIQPVKVGTASATLEGWAANRRRGETEKDEVLTVTRIDAEDGKPLAAFVHWAAHPTFMDSSDMMFSGGWPGHLQRTLEALAGEGFFCLYSNGAVGDQRPVARPDSGPSNWEKAERYGREIALQAHLVWSAAETRPVRVFSYHLETIDLPPRSWHPDFMQTGGAEYGLREDLMEVLIDQMVPPQSVCGVLRIDDLLLIGVPGEMASKLGKDLKAEAADLVQVKHPLVAGLANEWVSYILSPEQYSSGGGYEASVSFYGPQLGPKVIEGALSAVRNLN